MNNQTQTKQRPAPRRRQQKKQAPTNGKAKEAALENRQLVPTVEGTQLAQYGERNVVLELMERVITMHPAIAKGKVPRSAALTVAQMAIAYGASPIPGLNELHVYDDGKVELGINWWRRRADTNHGGVYWDIEVRPMTRQEEEKYSVISNTQIGAICRGVLADVLEKWLERGLPLDKIVASFGVTGIGVAGKREQPKKGRPVAWSAMKRAQTDFFKQATPFKPGEQFQAGAGLRANEGGGFQVASGPDWNIVSDVLDDVEYEVPDEIKAKTTQELEDELFGSNPLTDPPQDEYEEGEYEEVESEEETGFDHGLLEGDEAMVVGNKDERLGTVLDMTEEFVLVEVGGNKLWVKPERLTLVNLTNGDDEEE